MRCAEAALTEQLVDVRFIASNETVGKIHELVSQRGYIATETEVRDPGSLGLDLAGVADLATIIGITFIGDPLVPFLVDLLGARNEDRRIVVETPIGRVTFESREALNDEQVREKLSTIVGLL